MPEPTGSQIALDESIALMRDACKGWPQPNPYDAAMDRIEAVYEALAGIANADTKYPSMPSGFTGDWRVLRDEARAVLNESEDGVWE